MITKITKKEFGERLTAKGSEWVFAWADPRVCTAEHAVQTIAERLALGDVPKCPEVRTYRGKGQRFVSNERGSILTTNGSGITCHEFEKGLAHGLVCQGDYFISIYVAAECLKAKAKMMKAA